ncbi:MAG: response regulator transcription factor [Verrucomicrobiales bacterium]|nr:response regulator transcription factor [Verrucomicrobiales bacterium]
MKLMIVDDNPRIRELVQRLGESSGASVVCCEDGCEAATAYRRERPDWVLMDLSMPGMDGLAATRGLMRDFPAARVILVSDLDTPSLRVAAAQAGARGYLIKDHLTEIRLLAGQGGQDLPPGMAEMQVVVERIDRGGRQE